MQSTNPHCLAANGSLNHFKRGILLVDDHPIVREGLADLINHQGGLLVCGTAEEMNQAFEQIEKLTPDLVVLDITLKGSKWH